MMDRLLVYTLQLTIVGLICGCAIGSMVAGYQGFLMLLTRQSGGGWIALSLGLGIFSYQLCRHRNDLVDR